MIAGTSMAANMSDPVRAVPASREVGFLKHPSHGIKRPAFLHNSPLSGSLINKLVKFLGTILAAEHLLADKLDGKHHAPVHQAIECPKENAEDQIAPYKASGILRVGGMGQPLAFRNSMVDIPAISLREIFFIVAADESQRLYR